MKQHPFIQISIYLIVFFLLTGCKSDELKIQKGYPRWLKAENKNTLQTSGIAFIKRDKENNKHFLLADDVGKLHHFIISPDEEFTLKDITFSEAADTFFSSFPRRDFEELAYDKSKNEVFISIEGHSPDLHEAGIYKLIFYQNDPLSDSVVNIERVELYPVETIRKYLANNIGFEGLAVDENNYYLGLEGFSDEGIFADSTLIYIVSKKDHKLKRIINTKSLGIESICGMFSDGDNSLMGVDRNKKKFFTILLDDSGEIIKFNSIDLKSIIPGYQNLQYTASFEGITMDDEQNIYLTDDPWEKFFVPSKEILQRLDDMTKDNFRNFIPVIYKYKFR